MSLLTMTARTKCTLRRKATTGNKDASGGMKVVYADVSGAVNVPCHLQPATGSVRAQFMEDQMNVSHTVWLTRDIGALAGDIVVIGSRKFLIRGKEQPAPGFNQWPSTIHVEEQLG